MMSKWFVSGVMVFVGCQGAATNVATEATATAAAPSATALAPEIPKLSASAQEAEALNTLIAFMKIAKSRKDAKGWKQLDEQTDTNDLLGRPGQYIAKVVWTVNGGDATIEVFASLDDAKNREAYVRKISEAAPMFLQYIYLHEGRKALMRIPKEAKPSQAAEWDALLKSI